MSSQGTITRSQAKEAKLIENAELEQEELVAELNQGDKQAQTVNPYAEQAMRNDNIRVIFMRSEQHSEEENLQDQGTEGKNGGS